MPGLPPIHLINLDRSTERLHRFQERNFHLPKIVRVPAVDGSALDREELIRTGVINRDLPYAAGTLGCAMSHLRLWKMAASQNQNITIFEDDIVVAHQFEARAQKILSLVPKDWDFILWGHSFNPLFVWFDQGISKARLQGYGARRYQTAGEQQLFQTQESLSVPLKLLHSFGTLGYSISAEGARSALKYCLPLCDRFVDFPDAGVTTRDEGIDVVLCGLYPTLNAFICIPPLLIHSDDEESVRKDIDAK